MFILKILNVDDGCTLPQLETMFLERMYDDDAFGTHNDYREDEHECIGY